MLLRRRSRPRDRPRPHDPPVGVRPAPGRRRDRDGYATAGLSTGRGGRSRGRRRPHRPCVTPLARQARQLSAYPVGDLACFNVDFSREFRYCLETGADPTPASELSTLRLSVPVTETSNDVYGGAVRCRRHRHRLVDGYPDRRPRGARNTRSGRLGLLDERDRPDAVRDGDGRRRRRLLAKSVAGRRLSAACEPVDVLELRPRRSLAGAVQRARPGDHRRVEHVLLRGDEPRRRPRPRVALEKAVQELAWASIGNVLTAIQICEANDRGVLVPWNSWRHEFYKPVGTLHDADRGGFIFAPEVGLHENVHELDFSSLYPNIICTRNVSPDVIRCDCHSDRDDVPGLGYSICDDRGYLVDVPPADHRRPRRDQGGHPSREGTGRSRRGPTGGTRGTVGSAEVDPRCLFRLSRVQQREIWPHRVSRSNQRVRSRDSADGETAAGSRRLAGRSRHRRLHLGDPDPDVDDDDREDLETLATESQNASRFGSNTKPTTTGWRSSRSARATPAR